jgi:hypothetical protein
VFKIIKKLKRAFFSIDNMQQVIRYTLKSERLLERVLHSNEYIINNDGSDEYIVSLTTYSKRIHDVHLVIESIAMQTVKPNRILLWLDEDEFDIDSLPILLTKQIKRGLEVRFCPNYKSYKKLIPSLALFPDANIITLDDDIVYPVDMLEQLINQHKKFPRDIIGHRAHKIKVDANDVLLPYLKWELETKDHHPGHKIFLTTGAGTLFPCHIFSTDATEPSLFLTLCPSADDVWFKVMAIKHKIKCKTVDDPRDFSSRFMFIPDNQDIGLSLSNVHKNMNDLQLKNVLDHFTLTINPD